MTVKTASVFLCNSCGYAEASDDGVVGAPLEWFTIRVSQNATASASDDKHLCPNCSYSSIWDLWNKFN